MMEKRPQPAPVAQPHNKDLPCDICGNIGILEVIATCSKCHKSRQHIYCMHPNTIVVPNSWHCETCRLNNLDCHESCLSDDPKRCNQEELQDSPKRKKAWSTINGSGKPVACKRIGSSSATPGRILSRNFVPKKVETGKVKFLALEEIYANTSSVKQNTSSEHSSHSPQIGSFGIDRLPLSRKNSAGVSASSESSPKKLLAPTNGKETCLKSLSQFPCRSPISENSTTVVNATSMDKGKIGDGHSPLLDRMPLAFDVQEKHNLENTFPGLDNHAGKVNFSLSKKFAGDEKEVVTARCTKKDRTSNSKNILKFGEEDLPNPPAVKASWKGSFLIHDFPGNLDGFQAYLPGKVSRKAFLVSEQMPSELLFTLQHRSKVWPETFKEDSPSGFDIALYFLANSVYRSKECNHLLELLEKKDLSMQCHLDSVDLLVFTSKQLPPESQRIYKQFYLWGIFVSLKERQSVDKKGEQLALNSKPCYRIGEDPAVVDHDLDMEIDMVGGKEVGIRDIFLRGNTISACWGGSDSPSQNGLPSTNSDSLDTPPGFSKSTALVKVSPGVLKVTHGFSKTIKLEEWDSDSSPKVTHLEGGKEVGAVDKDCGNSRPACLDNSDVSSQNLHNRITSNHKDSPPGFSKLSAVKKMPPDMNKLNAYCLSSSIKLEKRQSSPECASESEKSIVVAQEAIRASEDAVDVVCIVCQEGYNLRPNDILGICTYSKRVDLDVGSAAISRHVGVYSTISNFNIIHFRCHQEAEQGAAGLKNPNSEWKRSILSNSEAVYNCIFPLRGPSVQLLTYQNLVSKYWDGLNLLHGPADGDHLRLLIYDIVLMLSRFATGDSFNTNSKDETRETNARFLPFMIQMAQGLIEQGRNLYQRESMVNGISSYLSYAPTYPDYSGPPGFHRQRLTEENVMYMMLNSLFFESYESWLAHRQAFLQRAIYHVHLRNKHGRPVLALPSVETCVKPEPVDTGQIFDYKNYLFSTIQPMLVYVGLIEQLQSFLKLSSTRISTGVKTGQNEESGCLEGWEVIMKAKLVNVKEMLDFSKNMLSWLDDMKSAKDLEETFFVMGALTDVLAGGFTSCEDFVQAATESGKKW